MSTRNKNNFVSGSPFPSERSEEEGGEEFTRIDCLNDDPAFADALAEVVHAALEAAGDRLQPQETGGGR